MHLKRRTVLSGLVGLSIPFVVGSCTSDSPNATTESSSATPQSPSTTAAESTPAVIRIGYQKLSELDLIRTRGLLDKQLAELGTTAEWSFFQAGPPMLEAMNGGSLDFGGVGEAPPVFAQAAGAEFYYVASTPRGPLTQDIVVPKDSSIQSAADLRGKRVALQKGSSAHYLLVTVLKENNVPVEEVEVVSLSPADARAAFEQGNVDAWSIWDPFLAVAEDSGGVRNLKVGRDRRAFFLASKSFTDQRPDLVRVVLEAAKENEVWGQQNSEQIAEQFSKELQIPAEIIKVANDRREWGLLPINEQAQANQQKVADTFYELKIIPNAVDIQEAVISPKNYTKVFPG